jgi:hypothetical protein
LSIILIGLFVANAIFRFIEAKTVQRWECRTEPASCGLKSGIAIADPG